MILYIDDPVPHKNIGIILLTETPTLLLSLLSLVTVDTTAISASATKVNGFDLVCKKYTNAKLQ